MKRLIAGIFAIATVFGIGVAVTAPPAQSQSSPIACGICWK
ncbi:hypothetical protein CLV47_11463 [Antricoccus suffuscus]|uniref:Uncharacterized protein n=1 Tax=Antricoccus suffuscus TaxID=1629062 RepID=A0A2T0ZWP3_9ACTN|nr:hypothetical protein CLV47_11463 [Antricoccus suffuscus]